MRSLVYVLLFGIVFSASAQKMGKQSLGQLKESPAGSRIIWFIDVIRTGEEVPDKQINEQFAAKLVDKMGMKKLKSVIQDIQMNDGALTLYVAKREKMFQYKLRLKGKKSGEWLEMQFFFEEKDPYRILGFTIDSVPEGNNLLEPIYPQ